MLIISMKKKNSSLTFFIVKYTLLFNSLMTNITTYTNIKFRDLRFNYFLIEWYLSVIQQPIVSSPCYATPPPLFFYFFSNMFSYLNEQDLDYYLIL